MLAFFARLTVGYYVPLSERYGLSLLGLFMALIAVYLSAALGRRPVDRADGLALSAPVTEDVR